MSAEATAAIFRIRLGNSSARLVLYSLADHHNRSTGRCFPSVKTLIHDTELSRMTIFRALGWLEEKGLIRREASHHENGRQTNNDYSLLFLEGGGYQIDTGRVSDRDGGGYHGDTGEGITGDTPLKTTGRYNQEEETPPTPSEGESECQEPPAAEPKKGVASEDGLTAAERKLGEVSLVHLAKHALGCYNELAARHGLPIAAKLNKFRMRIVSRIEEAGGMEGFCRVLENVPKSPFLLGQTARDGWKLDFDFLCQEKTFTRLQEGFYTPGKGAGCVSNGRFYAKGTF